MQDVNSAAPAAPGAAEGFWPKGWWSLVDFKIGIIPLPVFVILLALITAFTLTGKVPSDILMAIVLLSSVMRLTKRRSVATVRGLLRRRATLFPPAARIRQRALVVQ